MWEKKEFYFLRRSQYLDGSIGVGCMEALLLNKSDKKNKKAISYIDKTVQDTASSFIKKSNALIMKVGKTSLLSEKVFLYALKSVKKKEGQMENGKPIDAYYADVYKKTNTNFADGLISEITNAELRAALGNKNGSYYNFIDKLMNDGEFRSNWNILYKDKDFIGNTAVIIGTLYDRRKGTILIKWNPDIEHLIYNLSGNYTELNEKVMFGFKYLYSYNLYQLLRSGLTYQQAIDKQRGYAVDHEYEIIYELSELKFMMGVLSINLDDREPGGNTKDVVKMIKANNYPIAEELLQTPEPIMARYTDIKRYAIAKAYLEINGFKEDDHDTEEIFYEKVKKNSKVDLHFRYEPLRKGRGGKVYAVRFLVGWNRLVKNNPCVKLPNGDVIDIVEPDAGTMMELMDEVSDIIPVTLKPKEYKAILKAAEYKIVLVEKAVRVMEKSRNIKDVVAFLIAAIREDYGESKSYAPDKQNNGFANFSQRTYNYEQLELELLNMADGLEHVPLEN